MTSETKHRRRPDGPVLLQKAGIFTQGLQLTFEPAGYEEPVRTAVIVWLRNNPSATRATVNLPPEEEAWPGGNRRLWLCWEYDGQDWSAGRTRLAIAEAAGYPLPETGFTGWDFWRLPDGRIVSAAYDELR
ncbi:hypothetical protein [Streptomyces sp. NBC_00454]|uniref:hypothetical protein n=1 Tax=Streptomyces sp. NBC_00454 TaxID=2975747 RepID=UPI0030E1B550